MNLQIRLGTQALDGSLTPAKISTNPTDVFSFPAIEVTATDNGFLLPRLTTVQRDAIVSPTAGLEIYNTDTNQAEIYNGTIWTTMGGGGSPGGATTQVQYNNAGAFAGDSEFTWDSGSTTLRAFAMKSAAYQVLNGAGTTVIASTSDDGNGNAVFGASGLNGIGFASFNGAYFQVDNGGLQFSKNATSYTGDPSAMLQIDTNTQGFLPPRLTTAERDAVATPAAGLEIYNTDTNKPEVYNGSVWEPIGGASGTPNAADSTSTSAHAIVSTYPSWDLASPFVNTFTASSNTARIKITLTGSITTNKSDTVYITVLQDDTVNLADSLSGGSNTYFQAVKGPGDNNAETSAVTVILPVSIDFFVTPGDTAAHSYKPAFATETGIGGIIWNDNSVTSEAAVFTMQEVVAAGGGGAPAGTNTQIQFNSNGSFGASAGFTINQTVNGSLTLTMTPQVDPGNGAGSILSLNSGVSGGGSFLTFSDIGTQLHEIDFNHNGTSGGTSGFIAVGIDAMIFASAGRIGMGDSAFSFSPDNSAVLDVQCLVPGTTPRGFLLPRLTTAQRDAVTAPATGLMIYNTDTNAFEFYNGTVWAGMGGGSVPDPLLLNYGSSGAPTYSFLDTDGFGNQSGMYYAVGVPFTAGSIRFSGAGTDLLIIDGSTGNVSIPVGALSVENMFTVNNGDLHVDNGSITTQTVSTNAGVLTLQTTSPGDNIVLDSATGGGTAIQTDAGNHVWTFKADGALVLPNLTSQPGTPTKGQIIYNSTLNKLQFYNGTTWETVTSA